jgi:hypothetical protein
VGDVGSGRLAGVRQHNGAARRPVDRIEIEPMSGFLGELLSRGITWPQAANPRSRRLAFRGGDEAGRARKLDQQTNSESTARTPVNRPNACCRGGVRAHPLPPPVRGGQMTLIIHAGAHNCVVTGH